jgi:protein deglycase
MNLRVLVPLADGTEEIEAVTIIDILRRAGIDVLVAGTTSIVQCSRGIKLISDCLISEIDILQKFDAIILPGGMAGVQNLANNEHLSSLIKNHRRNSLLGAICAAPTILADTEIFKEGAIITSHPSVQDRLTQFNYLNTSTVLDDNIITSRGAGTAMQFALRIVEVLIGSETSTRIASDILFKMES